MERGTIRTHPTTGVGFFEGEWIQAIQGTEDHVRPRERIDGRECCVEGEAEEEGGWKALRRWYKGPMLVEALDGLMPAKREFEKPLRTIVTDVSSEGKNITVRGRVVQGFVRAGDGIVVLPVGDDANVVSRGEKKGHEGRRQSVFLRSFFCAVLWECCKFIQGEGSGGYSRITKLHIGRRVPIDGREYGMNISRNNQFGIEQV